MVDKEKIFEYIDWTTLFNEGEVLCMAQCAYAYAVYGDTDKQLSRWEVLESEQIAQEYIERKQITFDDDWNIELYNPHYYLY